MSITGTKSGKYKMKQSLCFFIILAIFKEALLDRLAGVGCDVDPEGYVVPDPDYCNR